MHRHLRDAGELVFDGILHRNDLLGSRLAPLQRCVERGGLPRPRGAGNEQHAVWPVRELRDSLERFRIHAQLIETHRPAATVEKTEHDALAEDCLLYTSPSPRDGLLSRMPS